MDVVAIERHALPLGQRMDDLRVGVRAGNIEADRALHAVEIVVQAGGGLHEQGGGDPAQAQVAAQGILKDPLEQADGLLGVVEVQQGGVVLRDVGLGRHSDGLLSDGE